MHQPCSLHRHRPAPPTPWPSVRRILQKSPSRCVTKFRTFSVTNLKTRACNAMNYNSTYRPGCVARVRCRTGLGTPHRLPGADQPSKKSRAREIIETRRSK